MAEPTIKGWSTLQVLLFSGAACWATHDYDTHGQNSVAAKVYHKGRNFVENVVDMFDHPAHRDHYHGHPRHGNDPAP